MTLEGTVKDGVVVLDPPAQLPEGVRVEVVPKESRSDASEPQPTLIGLLKLAGIAKDLPADFAEQHDHYIHGTPKR